MSYLLGLWCVWETSLLGSDRYSLCLRPSVRSLAVLSHLINSGIRKPWIKRKDSLKLVTKSTRKLWCFSSLLWSFHRQAGAAARRAELWRKVAAARESARKFKRHNSPFLLTARYSTAGFKCCAAIICLTVCSTVKLRPHTLDCWSEADLLDQIHQTSLVLHSPSLPFLTSKEVWWIWSKRSASDQQSSVCGRSFTSQQSALTCSKQSKTIGSH